MQNTAAELTDEHTDLEEYMAQGASRARVLDNRGPIRRTASGAIDPEIIECYWRHGFYIFENVFGAEELRDLEADFEDILDRLPTHKGSAVDAKGRPALGTDCQGGSLH